MSRRAQAKGRTSEPTKVRTGKPLFPAEITARLLERPARVSSFAPPPPDIRRDPDAAWRRLGTHIPPQREALLVLRGACTQSLNGALYRGTPGTLFLFDLGDRHDVWIPPHTTDVLVLQFQIYREFILARMLIGKRQRIHTILHTMLPDPQLPGMLNEVWNRRTQSGDLTAATQVQVEALLAHGFASIARMLRKGSIPPFLHFPERTAQTRDHQIAGMLMLDIGFRNGNPKNVRRMIRDSGYTLPHLNQIFRANVGYSLKTHIDAWRLRRLRILGASHPLLPAKVLAQELGFASASSFDNWRRRHGIDNRGRPLAPGRASTTS